MVWVVNTSTNMQMQMTMRMTTDMMPISTMLNDKDDMPVLLRIALPMYCVILLNM